MGSVDVIPGISGGTIAFITGIYHDLIKSIDRFSFKKLIKGQFRILWVDVNGSFLLSLFCRNYYWCFLSIWNFNLSL